MKILLSLLLASTAGLAADTAAADHQAVVALAARLAYPGAAAKLAARKRLSKAEAAGNEAALAAAAAAAQKSQSDIYATKDTLPKILDHYQALLTGMGFTNHVPRKAAGQVLFAGYMKAGMIVTVTAIQDPDTNVALEKGQRFPPGTQGVVVDVNKGF